MLSFKIFKTLNDVTRMSNNMTKIISRCLFMQRIKIFQNQVIMFVYKNDQWFKTPEGSHLGYSFISRQSVGVI
jgi:hypothetical protein